MLFLFTSILLLLSSPATASEPAAPVPSIEPSPPASLVEQPVTLGTGEWAVPARITLPKGKGPFPGVVLVHGSGPGTMDLNVGGSTIFRDLSWGLAERGIAVLRYQKRATQYRERFKERGRPPSLEEEYIEDASSAATLLRTMAGVDPANIYIFGNSMGGILAPLIANKTGAAGSVTMAGSPRRVGDVIIQQTEYVSSISTDSATLKRAAEVRAAAERINNIAAEKNPDEVIHGSPVWVWRELASIKPIDEVKRIVARGGRVLIMHGDRDYLVTEADWAVWTEQLKNHPGVTLKAFPKLNHIMQEGEGKMTPAEYEWTRPVSKAFIDYVAAWIRRKGSSGSAQRAAN